MNCPNKICAQDIPDDSCFCDQCGIQLYRCEKCNFVGSGKFCGSCGGTMSAIQAASAGASPAAGTPTPAAPTPAVTPTPAAPTPVTPAPAQTPAPTAAPTPAPGATAVVMLPGEKIFLCHPEGWNIQISNEDILGRTNGPFTAQLGKYPVISSNHAKVTLVNNEWFITDLKSTNKTYINGTKLEPNVPAKIKQNDVVILANITFTVRER